MSITALDALALFHEITTLADHGEDLVASICTHGGDRSQVPDMARAWAREVLEARVEHPELPDPSGATDMVLDYWGSKAPQQDLKALLERLNEPIVAIHAVANKLFESSPEQTMRFVLLYELYDAHKSNAGLLRDGLPAMFCKDHQTISRWLRWAADHYLIEQKRGQRGVIVAYHAWD